jgi:hypothetical protein
LGDDEAGLVAFLIGFVAYGMVDGVFYHAVALLCFVVIMASWIAMRPPIDASVMRNSV